MLPISGDTKYTLYSLHIALHCDIQDGTTKRFHNPVGCMAEAEHSRRAEHSDRPFFLAWRGFSEGNIARKGRAFPLLDRKERKSVLLAAVRL